MKARRSSSRSGRGAKARARRMSRPAEGPTSVANRKAPAYHRGLFLCAARLTRISPRPDQSHLREAHKSHGPVRPAVNPPKACLGLGNHVSSGALWNRTSPRSFRAATEVTPQPDWGSDYGMCAIRWGEGEETPGQRALRRRDCGGLSRDSAGESHRDVHVCWCRVSPGHSIRASGWQRPGRGNAKPFGTGTGSAAT